MGPTCRAGYTEEVLGVLNSPNQAAVMSPWKGGVTFNLLQLTDPPSGLEGGMIQGAEPVNVLGQETQAQKKGC